MKKFVFATSIVMMVAALLAWSYVTRPSTRISRIIRGESFEIVRFDIIGPWHCVTCTNRDVCRELGKLIANAKASDGVPLSEYCIMTLEFSDGKQCQRYVFGDATGLWIADPDGWFAETVNPTHFSTMWSGAPPTLQSICEYLRVRRDPTTGCLVVTDNGAIVDSKSK